MAEYNRLRDIELKRRRDQRERQYKEMYKQCDLMVQAKQERKVREKREEQLFAQSLIKADEIHNKREEEKAKNLRKKYKSYQKEIARLEMQRRRTNVFDDDESILRLNYSLIQDMKKNSKEVDVTDIIENLPKAWASPTSRRKNTKAKRK